MSEMADWQSPERSTVGPVEGFERELTFLGVGSHGRDAAQDLNQRWLFRQCESKLRMPAVVRILKFPAVRADDPAHDT
jgi:hypothetical protein